MLWCALLISPGDGGLNVWQLSQRADTSALSEGRIVRIRFFPGLRGEGLGMRGRAIVGA